MQLGFLFSTYTMYTHLTHESFPIASTFYVFLNATLPVIPFTLRAELEWVGFMLFDPLNAFNVKHLAGNVAFH